MTSIADYTPEYTILQLDSRKVFCLAKEYLLYHEISLLLAADKSGEGAAVGRAIFLVLAIKLGKLVQSWAIGLQVLWGVDIEEGGASVDLDINLHSVRRGKRIL